MTHASPPKIALRLYGGCLAAILVCLLLPTTLLAQSCDELAQNANSEIRAAERAMHSGQNEKAAGLLDEVAVMLEQIEQTEPGHSRLQGLQSKYQRIRKQVDRKLGSSSPAPATTASTTAATAKTSDKLPGGVSKRIRDIDSLLAKVQSTLDTTSADPEWRVKQAGQYLASAEALLQEIDSRYGKDFSPDHPEYAAVKDRLADSRKALAQADKQKDEQIAASQALSARQEAQSRYWLERLEPFVAGPADPNHDPERYLVAGGTVNSAELNERQRIYTRAKAVFDEYRAADFPDGKTQELEQVDKKLAYALETFEQAYKESLGLMAGDARQQLDQAEAFLSREDWKDDPTAKPVVWSEERLDALARAVAAYGASVQPGDARLEDMEASLGRVRELNAARQEAAVSRTYMQQDAFKGSAGKQIKETAEAEVRQEHPGATLLRTTVISPDWKEERVLEYTDTTKTALQYRITRSVTAQVAAKDQGDCSLYTLHVASDQRSDGSWGPLKAHIMFTDGMLEANVDRKGP